MSVFGFVHVQFMLLAQTYPQKIRACKIAVKHLLASAKDCDDKAALSHHLLETILYYAQVDLLASSTSKQVSEACMRLEHFIRPEVKKNSGKDSSRGKGAERKTGITAGKYHWF